MNAKDYQSVISRIALQAGVLFLLGATVFIYVQQKHAGVLVAENSSATVATVGTTLYSEWRDFLVQNVCLNSDGVVIADDPGKPSSGCVRQRNLLSGEDLPYRRSDGVYKSDATDPQAIFESNARSGEYFQFWDSLDLGNGLYISTMNHERNTDLQYKNLSSFNPWGLNVMKEGFSIFNTGSWISVIATRDASQRDEKAALAQHFLDPKCLISQSWLLFPTDLSVLKTQGSVIGALWRVAYMSDRTNVATCQSGNIISGQHYAQRVLRTYASGKTLDTIVTYHQAYAPTLNLKNYEYLYFTKEYGLTRWESWTNASGAVPTEDLSGLLKRYGRCNGSDYAADLIRTDCRDVTAVHLIDNRDKRPHPQSLFNLNEFPQFRKNFISNADFMGVFIDGNRDGSFGKWSRIYSNNDILDWAILPDPFKFKWLAFSCRNSCLFLSNGVAVPLELYVDGDISQFKNGQEIEVGATFKMHPSTTVCFLCPPYKNLKIVINQFGATKNLLPNSTVSSTVDILAIDPSQTQLKYFKKKVTKLNGAYRIRFSLQPQSPQTIYQMTMPYIAVTEKSP